MRLNAIAESARTPAQANARAEERARLATIQARTRFLREFAICGIVLRSARAAKVGRRTVYDWLQADAAFKALYNEAYDDAVDAMEEEARRRSQDGVLEPVFQGGIKVGSIRKYSDSLMLMMLKARRPEKFRDRLEHTGKNGGPIEMSHHLKEAKAALLDKLTRLSTRTAPTEEPHG